MSKNIPSPIIYRTKYNRDIAIDLDQQIKQEFEDQDK